MENFHFVLPYFILILPLIWFFTDPRPKQERIKYLTSPQTILYTISTIFLFGGAYFFADTLPFEIGIDRFVGWMLFILGFVIAVWAKVTMGKSWGVPYQHNSDRQNKLIISGPFKYSRNPIYVGLIFIYFGYCLILNSAFVFFIIPFFWYFHLSVLKEEKFLEKNFEENYKEYKKTVPRYLW